MKISVYGASDDIVTVNINGTFADEFSAYSAATHLYIDSKDGGVDIAIKHGQGWETTVSLPEGHEDNAPALPVTMQMSETGYSYETVVEVDDETATLIVVQDDVTKAVLGTNGKLLGWDEIVETRNSLLCKHGMFETGTEGVCPRCSRKG